MERESHAYASFPDGESTLELKVPGFLTLEVLDFLGDCMRVARFWVLEAFGEEGILTDLLNISGAIRVGESEPSYCGDQVRQQLGALMDDVNYGSQSRNGQLPVAIANRLGALGAADHPHNGIDPCSIMWAPFAGNEPLIGHLAGLVKKHDGAARVVVSEVYYLMSVVVPACIQIAAIQHARSISGDIMRQVPVWIGLMSRKTCLRAATQFVRMALGPASSEA